MPYAEATRVPVASTRASIETMLRKAGATRIVLMDEPSEALVMFMLAERLIKVRVAMPPKVTDQRRRSLWRALMLVIKAKRETVEAGIETVEEAWLAHTVMPDGQRMAEWIEPQLRLAYQTGRMPEHPLMLQGPTA